MPGIVVLHTARGLSRGIQLWTDRLAEEGYAAIAIDLYKGRVGENREHARALRDEANGRPDENMAIIRDAYEHLASDPNVRATRRALIGWSYGAGWATVMASRLPGLSAVIAHYGAADLGPDAVARMQAPFLLICGDRDEEREGMAALEGALRSARKSVEVLWTQANHGFADPSHAGYDGLVAARSYAEVRRFLAATLH